MLQGLGSGESQMYVPPDWRPPHLKNPHPTYKSHVSQSLSLGISCEFRVLALGILLHTRDPAAVGILPLRLRTSVLNGP